MHRGRYAPVGVRMSKLLTILPLCPEPADLILGAAAYMAPEQTHGEGAALTQEPERDPRAPATLG